nr:Asparagine synthetase domain-containing protein 1 [Polyrhizophydium stewartii]
MCGILLALAAVREGGPPEHGGLRMHEDLLQRLRAANAMRGPDAHGYSAWVAGGVAAEMHGWVLHLRGTAVSPQPVTDARTGSILCFNGEVFGGLDVPPDVCDTDVVAAELAAAVCESDVLRAMSRIDGEWAFVYYHLGGYGRHRVQFVKQGWQGLISELQLDVSRISTRNLGRDDRIVSSHGKEVRFPFLDSGVTRLLCRMPVHLKTDPRLAKGVGDKLVLRLVASALGLTRAALEPKRAVQFGARTAKMETSKQRGQDLAGE